VQPHWAWLRDELSRMTAMEAVLALQEVFRQDYGPRLRQAPALPPAAYVSLTRDRMCRPRLQRAAARALGGPILEVSAAHDLPLADPATYAAVALEAISALQLDSGRSDAGPAGAQVG
jgi:hypothetical protein